MLRMQLHALARSMQWRAATQKGEMPLCFLSPTPAVCSCSSLPVPTGTQSEVQTHQKPLATQQLAACAAAQTSQAWAQASGHRGQVAGAAPLAHETIARTVGNPFSNPNCPLVPSFGSAGEPWLWKEKPTSQSRGVFRTLLPIASARTIRQPAGPGRKRRGRRGRSKPPHAKEKAPPRLLAARLLAPTTSAHRKGNLPPEGDVSSVLICLSGLPKTNYVWCFKTVHFWYF